LLGQRPYAFGLDVKPAPNFDLPATFDGIRRPDRRVATMSLRSGRCTAPVQHSLCIPTIDDRLAWEGNRGPDLNSRRTMSHIRLDGFIPIL
jgi:hypothetical protein